MGRPNENEISATQILNEIGTARDNEVLAAAPGGVKLSDGRIAKVRRAKGRDLEKGAAVASDASNPMALFMGVVAQVTLIDGAKIVYEDVLDLDLSDVMLLIAEVGGNVGALSRVSAISS